MVRKSRKFLLISILQKTISTNTAAKLGFVPNFFIRLWFFRSK